MSVSAAVPSAAKTRDRSIEARRKARARKAERERLILDYLNRGVSVAEIAAHLGVTEKRMRANVREALARRMPAPPEEFVALQVNRLNEALLVAYSAMSGMNLKAVDRVVRIVSELDRYHGFFAAGRRSLPATPMRAVEAEAESPLALLAHGPGIALQALEQAQSAPRDTTAWMCHPGGSGDPGSPGAMSQSFAALRPWMPACAVMTKDATCERLEMAPQIPEMACSAPGDAMAGMCHSGGSGDPGSPGAISQSFAARRPWMPACAGMIEDANFERRETAPQAAENSQSAPENNSATESSQEPVLASLAGPAQASGALAAPLPIDRAETAPQASEKAQFEPENDGAPACSDEALAAEAAPLAAADPVPATEAFSAPAADPEPAAEASPAGPILPAPAADAASVDLDAAEEAFPAAETAPPPAIAANVPLSPHAGRPPGPTAFTGFIRCAGVTTCCI